MSVAWRTLLLLVFCSLANGLLDPALTPPMGWRSWNCFLNNINQEKIKQQIDALADGPLLQLGYDRIGIDGGWVCQNPLASLACTCGGVGGSYHSAEGTPVIGASRFPSLLNLSTHSHRKGILLDFYGNSCNCATQEHREWPGTGGGPNGGNVAADVAALHALGMDGIKVDGCGPAHNISKWVNELRALPGSPKLLENCGDNGNSWSAPPVHLVAKGIDCGFQMYRVSADIAPQFLSTMWNLQALRNYSDVARPSCWPYPDMLQVGASTLTHAEARTHFAAWAITSSPLILGYDLTDPSAHARAMAAGIANTRIIEINQIWAAHAGKAVQTSVQRFEAPVFHGAGSRGPGQNVSFPVSQVWAKPLLANNTQWAVLMVNIWNQTCDLVVNMSEIHPVRMLATAKAMDVERIWESTASGTWHEGIFRASQVAPHDSTFIVLTTRHLFTN